MNLMESFISAYQNVKVNKMRSFLTMLGIIIGISSVISIVSIGQGGKEAIMSEFNSLGTNIINFRISSVNNDVEDSDYFTLRDATLVKAKIQEVTTVVPIAAEMGHLSIENKKQYVEVDAVAEGYAKLLNIKLYSGRFLNEKDVQSYRTVVVLDEFSAERLFGKMDVVGEKIKISLRNNTMNALIIGVCKNPNGSLAALMGDNFTGTAYIPITVGEKVFTNFRISFFAVMLSDMNHFSEITSKIIHLLENTHRNSGKYIAEEGFAQVDMLDSVFNIITAVIGAIAGISLIVGGIGVMNIMLVSVTERTREIGIRKALGAKNRDIMLQFLTESIILCLIGGAIGMSLGMLVSFGVGKVINIQLGVSPLVILIAFGFSSAVGIFFGLYPANRAAKLDPNEALRYE
ncbi:MAG: ABC transporter permease [Clostridia bacterium]